MNPGDHVAALKTKVKPARSMKQAVNTRTWAKAQQRKASEKSIETNALPTDKR
jgi:hypothetical protein